MPPSGGSGVGHEEARGVRAQALGVTVNGARGAAQSSCSGGPGGKQLALPVRVDDLNGALGGRRGRKPSRICAVSLGAHQAQITNPVVRPIPVNVVYQGLTWVGAVVEGVADPVRFQAALT